MKKSTVHLFVFDTMSDWEYGYVVGAINNPQLQRAPGRFQIKAAALRDKPVTTAGGLRVTADVTLDEVQPANSAMLVLPGGAYWDQNKGREAAQLAAEFVGKAIPVAAICGATLGLARAGLLDAVPHTSNSKDYIAASGYSGSAFYRDKRAVRAKGLITASGVSPLEFAREVFAELGLYSAGVLSAVSPLQDRPGKVFQAVDGGSQCLTSPGGQPRRF